MITTKRNKVKKTFRLFAHLLEIIKHVPIAQLCGLG
jgi:hypothetical protein